MSSYIVITTTETLLVEVNICHMANQCQDEDSKDRKMVCLLIVLKTAVSMMVWCINKDKLKDVTFFGKLEMPIRHRALVVIMLLTWK